MDFKQVTDMCQRFVDIANCVEFKHFGKEPYTYKVNDKNQICIIIRDGKAVFVFRVKDNAVHLVKGVDESIHYDTIEELSQFLFVWSSMIPVIYGYH